MRLQCKDIPDQRCLAIVGDITLREDRPAMVWEVAERLDLPLPLVLAKMRKLVNKNLVEGCACGCRGDFRLPAAIELPEPSARRYFYSEMQLVDRVAARSMTVDDFRRMIKVTGI